MPLSTSFILDFGAVPTVSYLFLHCITILSLNWDPYSYLAYHDTFERRHVAPLGHIILISEEEDTGQFDTLVCVIGPFVAIHVFLDIMLSEQ